jgi:hypothetical protein
MNCPRCGYDNPEVHQFCGGCGTSLSTSTPLHMLGKRKELNPETKLFARAFLIGLVVVMPGGFLGARIASIVLYDILGGTEDWGPLVEILGVLVGMVPGVLLVDKYYWKKIKGRYHDWWNIWDSRN